MARGTINVPRKKVNTSGFVTTEEFKTFQETHKGIYESAKDAGYTGTEAEFWAAFNDLIINGGNNDTEVTIDVSTQTVTLTTEWTKQADGTHAQTIAVEGVTGDPEQPIWVDCSLTREDIEADIAVLEAWKCINTVEPAEGSLTFYCYGDVPTVAIPTNVVVM